MFRFYYCYLLALMLLHWVKGQGCSNQCPPLNAGTPVPSFCEGDYLSDESMGKTYDACHPTPSYSFRFNDFKRKGQVTVVSNYYTGCNAGRRESGVFAHVAQRYYNMYGNQTMFVSSLKGGGTCDQWASIYQKDAKSIYADDETNVIPKDMPITVDDTDYEIRDDLFTTPFGHPSYVILDENLQVRHKFIGPCCGYERYSDCTKDIAKTLDETLSEHIDNLLKEQEVSAIEEESRGDEQSDNVFEEIDDSTTAEDNCSAGEYSEWSPCSISCASSTGFQFRWRVVSSDSGSFQQCPTPVEKRTCAAQSQVTCEDGNSSCLPEFGSTWDIVTVASGFDSPRDVAFHPTPGLHFGSYSEGRTFEPNEGEEAWIVNGNNHSASIVASLGSSSQTTISRRDRGYYHYMINATALAFNTIGDSGRTSDRDSFNYWAVCNDNLNTYLGTKEPNYFQGPTLYNSDPRNRNTVNRLGEECKDDEPCYFLHSDMLHESPGCIGIAHDPETISSYGNVYWAFDATGDRETGQLVRFDFQQPHGPGSMDHSVAAIRRYVEVKLERGNPGVHAGMVVHPTNRELYISVPGSNKVVAVNADSGSYARTARAEYPIYSSRLPSFEYSIWECVDQRNFATDIKTPSGLAIGPDGKRLFVAERETGKILVYEIESRSLVYSIDTGFTSIGGMAFAPVSGDLYFVDADTNTLNAVKPTSTCTKPIASRVPEAFINEYNKARNQVDEQAGDGFFSLYRNYDCTVDPIIPDAALFDQVHDDSGYASENPNVQNDTSMDAEAALLANRTDCGATSELNFDALLLGGYFCHQCLPDARGAECDGGGECRNVQWNGYMCDNEFIVETENGVLSLRDANNTLLDWSSIVLRRGTTYRFTVRLSTSICISDSWNTFCATNGPLLWTSNSDSPESVYLLSEEGIYDGLVLSLDDKDTNATSPANESSPRPTIQHTPTSLPTEPSLGPTSNSDEGAPENSRNVPLIAGIALVITIVLVIVVVVLASSGKPNTDEGKQTTSDLSTQNEKTSDTDETQSQEDTESVYEA